MLARLIEVTIEADNLLTFTDCLALPVTLGALIHRVVVTTGVLEPKTVNVHVRAEFETDLDNGDSFLLTGRRDNIEVELFEDVGVAASACVKWLTVHFVGKVKLNGAQGCPVRADACQLDLLVQVPVVDLVFVWPFECVLAVGAYGLSEGRHLL